MKQHSSIYLVEKAATVPQIAFITPTARTTPSKMLQRPASMILAATGPITHSMKAEKEPRNAIIELNSGTRIETRIESDVTKIL